MTIASILFAAVLTAIGVWMCYLISHASTQLHITKLVYANLDNTLDNGHFEHDGHCFGMTAEDLALDLSLYAADLDDVDYNRILPPVRQWMAEHTEQIS